LIVTQTYQDDVTLVYPDLLSELAANLSIESAVSSRACQILLKKSSKSSRLPSVALPGVWEPPVSLSEDGLRNMAAYVPLHVPA